MADAPCKALGNSQQKYLQELIEKGTVDITKTANGAYINQVMFDHFRHCKIYNFRCNYHSFMRLRELVDHLSGYPQEQGGGKVLFLLFDLCYNISNDHPPPLSLNFRQHKQQQHDQKQPQQCKQQWRQHEQQQWQQLQARKPDNGKMV